MLEKYANLLIHYCLELKHGEKLYVRSTTLAEDLIREIYRVAIRAGAHVQFDIAFREQGRIFMSEASKHQLTHISPGHKQAMENSDAYLYIRAPYNLREDQSIDPKKRRVRQEAMQSIQRVYFERTGNGSMRRSLCQFPTQAAAQEAGMSLEEYQHFVFNACHLYDDDPTESWIQVRKNQQHIVDFLNKRDHIHYKSGEIDIQFSVKDRVWINSDGRANMPSGEVFTAPVEDSVNGTVHFSYPSIYMGHEVNEITLWVKNGYVEKWEAKKGKEFLDQLFKIKGSRYFGEVAIGTNYNIQRSTKNILFDEKIGGTIHMAVGQSYLQNGGKNVSPIHWDMIADMKNGGEIVADGQKIYQDGKFLI
jgi:aminopeptidase